MGSVSPRKFEGWFESLPTTDQNSVTVPSKDGDDYESTSSSYSDEGEEGETKREKGEKGDTSSKGIFTVEHSEESLTKLEQFDDEEWELLLGGKEEAI